MKKTTLILFALIMLKQSFAQKSESIDIASIFYEKSQLGTFLLGTSQSGFKIFVQNMKNSKFKFIMTNPKGDTVTPAFRKKVEKKADGTVSCSECSSGTISGKTFEFCIPVTCDIGDIIAAGLRIMGTKSGVVSTSYEFKPKNQQFILLDKPTDGDHVFFSSERNKLVLSIKNKKVVGQKLFTSSGKQIIEDKDPSGTNTAGTTARRCTSCFTIHNLDGTSQQFCHEVSCYDLDEIQKSLSDPTHK